MAVFWRSRSVVKIEANVAVKIETGDMGETPSIPASRSGTKAQSQSSKSCAETAKDFGAEFTGTAKQHPYSLCTKPTSKKPSRSCWPEVRQSPVQAPRQAGGDGTPASRNKI